MSRSDRTSTQIHPARRATGAHWLTDTVGGAACGAGVAAITAALLERPAPQPEGT